MVDPKGRVARPRPTVWAAEFTLKRAALMGILPCFADKRDACPYP